MYFISIFEMQTKLLKNCGIIVVWGLLGRGLFQLAQQWGLMTASVLDITEISQIKDSGRDIAYKAEDQIFELFWSEKLPTQWKLKLQLQYNPEKISLKSDSLSGYLESWTTNTGTMDIVLANYKNNPLNQHLFEIHFEGEEGQVVVAEAHFLDSNGVKHWLSIGNLWEHHHHDE